MPDDLPVLCWGGTSVVVASAHRDVRAAARHVAGSNDGGGGAGYLERLRR
jgi:hydroxymethylpyrimidine pyrophosphatase-like HAD family hydrolase